MEKTREIKIENDSLDFLFIEGDSVKNDLKLKSGKAYISKTFFKSKIPTVAEVEKALNFVEYELTEHKALRKDDEVLFCNDKILQDVLAVSDEKLLSRDFIEEVFNKYANYVEGEPAHVLQIDFSIERFVTILLIRVIMYYLDFDQLKIA